jgi:hypothetical protein
VVIKGRRDAAYCTIVLVTFSTTHLSLRLAVHMGTVRR